MSAQLKISTLNQTLVLTISNPEYRNALGPEIYKAGIEALNMAASSSAIQSIIITGEGTIFCAGGNLQRLLNNRNSPPEVQSKSIDGLLRSSPHTAVSSKFLVTCRTTLQ